MLSRCSRLFILLLGLMIFGILNFTGVASSTVICCGGTISGVNTNPATNVTTTTATLNGSVSAVAATQGSFDYGLNTSYGTTTSPTTVSSGSGVLMSTDITGLTPGSTYHFRAVATYSPETVQGDDLTFTTAAATLPGTAQPTLPQPDAAIQFPSTKTDPKNCKSRRKFKIRIVKPSNGIEYKEVKVFVNNKQVQIIKGDRITAPVNLTGLPKGTFKVKIIVATTDGRTIEGSRKYKTCRHYKGKKHKHKL